MTPMTSTDILFTYYNEDDFGYRIDEAAGRVVICYPGGGDLVGTDFAELRPADWRDSPWFADTPEWRLRIYAVARDELLERGLIEGP